MDLFEYLVMLGIDLDIWDNGFVFFVLGWIYCVCFFYLWGMTTKEDTLFARGLWAGGIALLLGSVSWLVLLAVLGLLFG